MTLAFMFGISTSVQIWTCEDDEAGVSRLVVERSIECAWDNSAFLQLRILSFFTFGLYFFGTMAAYLAVIDSKKGRHAAVAHRVTHAREMEQANLYTHFSFFWRTLLEGEAYYVRLKQHHKRAEAEALANGRRKYRPTVMRVASLGTLEAGASAPNERRHSRIGRSNAKQSAYLSHKAASFPVLVPPPAVDGGGGGSPGGGGSGADEVGAATKIQSRVRVVQAKASLGRLRSPSARLLRALEGPRGTMLVVLVVAIDIGLLIALYETSNDDGGGEDESGTKKGRSSRSLSFVSRVISFACSAFFVLDIFARFLCYVRTQPPLRRASWRASLANVDFFSRDRFRLLDLVIVLLDVGGVVLLVVLGGGSSSNSRSGLAFVKVNRSYSCTPHIEASPY